MARGETARAPYRREERDVSGGRGECARVRTRPVRAVDVEGLVLRAALVVQLGGARVGEVDLDVGGTTPTASSATSKTIQLRKSAGSCEQKVDCAGGAVVLKREGELEGEDAQVGGAQLVDGGDGREAQSPRRGDGVETPRSVTAISAAITSYARSRVDNAAAARALGEVIDDARGDDALQLRRADDVVLRERAPRLEEILAAVGGTVRLLRSLGHATPAPLNRSLAV